MEKRTLNECWELCLKMWKWVAWHKSRGAVLGSNGLKIIWARKHGFAKVLESAGHCFFCEYHQTHPVLYKEMCNCPAIKVDKDFYCGTEDYDYIGEPIKFYKKIVGLNKIRLAKGQ